MANALKRDADGHMWHWKDGAWRCHELELESESERQPPTKKDHRSRAQAIKAQEMLMEGFVEA